MTAQEIVMQLVKERSLAEGKVEGIAEGETKRNTIFVESLFRSTDFTDEKIATVAGVTLEFVKEIKQKIQ